MDILESYLKAAATATAVVLILQETDGTEGHARFHDFLSWVD